MLRKVLSQQSKNVALYRCSMQRLPYQRSFIPAQSIAATSLYNLMAASLPVRGFYYPDANHHHLQQEVRNLTFIKTTTASDQLSHS